MTTESGWVPDACTLPTVDQPLRVAAFDDLFARAVRGMDRPTATRLRLTLDPAAEASTRDLVAREADCCSFFAFTIDRTPGDLVLEVGVPAAQAAVLDGIASRVTAAHDSA
ncbi:MAG: hypothetical protein ABI808_00265 [Pseudonocardiales bacterium]